MSAPVLLSVEEAAARLGLAVGTVRHWVSQRRITCIKVGRRCRIPEAEVARILEAGTVLARDLVPSPPLAAARPVRRDAPGRARPNDRIVSDPRHAAQLSLPNPT